MAVSKRMHQSTRNETSSSLAPGDYLRGRKLSRGHREVVPADQIVEGQPALYGVVQQQVRDRLLVQIADAAEVEAVQHLDEGGVRRPEDGPGRVPVVQRDVQPRVQQGVAEDLEVPRIAGDLGDGVALALAGRTEVSVLFVCFFGCVCDDERRRDAGGG